MYDDKRENGRFESNIHGLKGKVKWILEIWDERLCVTIVFDLR
jgi:hypothetical protein